MPPAHTSRRSGGEPQSLAAVAAGTAWAWLMRLEARTWRRQVLGARALDELAASGERALIALWHGHYRPVLACVRDRPCVAVSTETFRGRLIDAALAGLGHRCARRPAGLRGERALAWLCDAVKGAERVVVVADGPAGPARRVKRGVVQLASRLGLRVVPCASASAWAVTRDRWDEQEIALPFARVAVVVGPPLPALPAPLGEAESAEWRERTARAIDACRQRAVAAVAAAGGTRRATRAR